MTKREIMVILRLAPEQIVGPNYDNWCTADAPDHAHRCVRAKGHLGKHVTFSGVHLRDDMRTPYVTDVYKLVIW